MAQTAVIREVRANGPTVDYLASEDKTSGDVVVVGSTTFIVSRDIDYSENPLGSVVPGIGEVWLMPQNAEIIAAGTKVYWDADGDPYGGTEGSGCVTATATGNTLIGIAAPVQPNGTAATTAIDSYIRVLPQGEALNVATIAGSMTADDITGSDAALSIGGKAGSSSVGGTVVIVGGAGDSTNAGGAVSLTGGESGDGATGNGGAASVVGGAAGSTNGTGGAVAVTGGVATGTGTGGAVTITSGASAGASGTAGAVSIDCGAATGGTAGAITIGGTNAGSITMGKMPIFPAATVAATGSDQSGAAAIATGITWVTAADATKGVKLPAAAAGLVCIVKNDDTANAVLKVYPNTDDTINALSANAALSMAAKTACMFVCYDGTAWFTVPLLPS